MTNKPNHVEVGSSIDAYEAAQQQARVNEFYNNATQPEHVGVEVVAPRLKRLYEPMGQLAVRDDNEAFGVTQVLYGILSTRDTNFGIVKADGQQLPKEGFRYLSRICLGPYGINRPEYIAHLGEGVPVILGGQSQLTKDMADSGHTVELIQGKGGRLSLQEHSWRAGRLSLIYSGGTATKEERASDFLVLEDHRWALPPDFVQRKAHKTLSFKRQSIKRSLTKVKAVTPALTTTRPSKNAVHSPMAATVKKTKHKKPSKAQLRRDAHEHILDSLDGLVI